MQWDWILVALNVQFKLPSLNLWILLAPSDRSLPNFRWFLCVEYFSCNITCRWITLLSKCNTRLWLKCMNWSWLQSITHHWWCKTFAISYWSTIEILGKSLIKRHRTLYGKLKTAASIWVNYRNLMYPWDSVLAFASAGNEGSSKTFMLTSLVHKLNFSRNPLEIVFAR